METIINKAFELGMPGFILLIVLLLLFPLVMKLSRVFTMIPEKFDVLTERIADSNATLSTQLVKTSVVQEQILTIMKETMNAVNNNTIRMATLEGKIENNFIKVQELSSKADVNIQKLEMISDQINNHSQKTI